MDSTTSGASQAGTSEWYPLIVTAVDDCLDRGYVGETAWSRILEARAFDSRIREPFPTREQIEAVYSERQQRRQSSSKASDIEQKKPGTSTPKGTQGKNELTAALRVWLRAKDCELSKNGRYVLAWLITYLDPRSLSAFPSIKTLAQLCHLSEHTVMRALDELQRFGVIEKTVGRPDDKDRRPNCYVAVQQEWGRDRGTIRPRVWSRNRHPRAA